MAAVNIQGRFDDEIERDPHVALLVSGDELLAVEQGLWGVMNLLCSDKPKKIRIDTDHFHFAVEPLLHRLEAARQLADRARARLPR
ncbi:hypothetical protein [Thauera propionica]|jgi:hypothetical protein|uniref:hypothetical protein n=1 Tax=Thauera propionica TaxID=2019431 RepID=UPI0023F1C9F4|nr:hypothetical protein [Thauera propionica]MDD3676524.1 hypothetical protein [Thauera propionica]